MRHARAFALLTMVALVSAFGWTAESSPGATVGSQAVAQPASGFAVTPNIADPSCNGGRGGRLTGPFGPGNSVASGSMADGSTLIAVTNVYPGMRSIVLRSVTRACVLNGAFGDGGAETITVPSDLYAR
jgi:hypothetical protein